MKNTDYIEMAINEYKKHEAIFDELKKQYDEIDKELTRIGNDRHSYQPSEKTNRLQAKKNEKQEIIDKIKANYKDYDNRLKGICKECNDNFSNYYQPNPKMLDTNALTAMKEGLYNENELATLYHKYTKENNVIMLRALSKTLKNSENPTLKQMGILCERNQKNENEVIERIVSFGNVTMNALGFYSGTETEKNITLANKWKPYADSSTQTIYNGITTINKLDDDNYEVIE